MTDQTLREKVHRILEPMYALEGNDMWSDKESRRAESDLVNLINTEKLNILDRIFKAREPYHHTDSDEYPRITRMVEVMESIRKEIGEEGK